MRGKLFIKTVAQNSLQKLFVANKEANKKGNLSKTVAQNSLTKLIIAKTETKIKQNKNKKEKHLYYWLFVCKYVFNLSFTSRGGLL